MHFTEQELELIRLALFTLRVDTAFSIDSKEVALNEAAKALAEKLDN